jgi:tyrosyl-tRNA synthetase
VADFHSEEAGAKASADWAKQFQKGGVPDEVDQVAIELAESALRLDKLLARAGLAESVSDAVRKVKQRAVKVNGELHEDPAGMIDLALPVTVQVGRKIRQVRRK